MLKPNIRTVVIRNVSILTQRNSLRPVTVDYVESAHRQRVYGSTYTHCRHPGSNPPLETIWYWRKVTHWKWCSGALLSRSPCLLFRWLGNVSPPSGRTRKLIIMILTQNLTWSHTFGSDWLPSLAARWRYAPVRGDSGNSGPVELPGRASTVHQTVSACSMKLLMARSNGPTPVKRVERLQTRLWNACCSDRTRTLPN